MLVKFEIFLPLLPLRFERMIPDPGPCSDWKLTRDVIVFIGGIGIPDECPVFDSGGAILEALEVLAPTAATASASQGQLSPLLTGLRKHPHDPR